MTFYRTVTLIIAAAVFLCGCSGNTEKSSDKSETGNSEDTASDSAVSENEDLCALAQSLSEDMAAGDFNSAVMLFSPELSAQLDESSLRTAWESTVASIGDFTEVSETSEEKTGDNTVVKSVLLYEKKGLEVSYTFNLSGEIEGIWLSYRALPAVPENGDSYTEQAIKIGSFELDGLLTMPNGVEDPPVVILVQGSGQSDMDESIGENKPFKDIAHGLAYNGIAVIRYNKRYYQYPELADDNITVRDEIMEDVSAAAEYAGTVCGSGKIIIAGHSLGGMLAPVMCMEDPDIDAMISLAGSPRRLEDIIYDQNEAALKASGIAEEELSPQLEALKEELEKISSLSETDTGEYFGVNAQYWRSLNDMDTVKAAESLDIPMLFVQGGDDFQVYADKDFEIWREHLGDRENCTFKLYEGLDHLFMRSNGRSDITEYDIKGNVSGEVISDISRWINGL